jgi:hypothetical protein
MAEEYVSKDQFGEFVRRMDAGFHTVEQRFATTDRRIDDLRHEVQRVDTRLLSVENWIRATFVAITVFGIGVVVQLVFLVMRLGTSVPKP